MYILHKKEEIRNFSDGSGKRWKAFGSLPGWWAKSATEFCFFFRGRTVCQKIFTLPATAFDCYWDETQKMLGNCFLTLPKKRLFVGNLNSSILLPLIQKQTVNGDLHHYFYTQTTKYLYIEYLRVIIYMYL